MKRMKAELENRSSCKERREHHSRSRPEARAASPSSHVGSKSRTAKNRDKDLSQSSSTDSRPVSIDSTISHRSGPGSVK